MTRIPSTLLLCVGLAGATEQVAAVEASEVLLFNWGPLTIKPQFAVSETYNDNIFSRGDTQTQDFLTTISPGATFLLGKRTGNNLVLTYTLDQHFYVDRSDLNSTEHSIDFSGLVEGDRLSLRGTDRIRFLSSPIGGDIGLLDPGAGDQPIIVTDDNVERTTFYDNYSLNYDISSKTALYVQGSHIAYDYEEGIRLFDQTTVVGTGGFAYRAFPKAILFGEGFFGITSSSPNVPVPEFADMTFTGGALGARGVFTTKLSGTLRLGYETREFQDGSGASGSPVVTIALNYQYSSKRSFSFNYSRRQDVSVQYYQQSYTAYIIGLQMEQAIGTKRKWRASLGGYYGVYDYTANSAVLAQDYDVYSVNFSMAYQIQKWLSASLGFDRTSVLAGSAGVTSYDVNRVTLRLAVGY